MNPSAKDILDQALKMSENDRAAIAERLLASLDAKPDQAVEEAWQQEIQRRLSAFDRGEIGCVPWEGVRARLGKKQVRHVVIHPDADRELEQAQGLVRRTGRRAGPEVLFRD